MFAGEARSTLNGAPERCLNQGLALVLPTNIGQGWKGLPGTNTPAYYRNPHITAVKRFIT